MKIPKAVEGARFCPLIKQGCIEDACMFWTEIWGTKQPSDEPVLDKDCSINWAVSLQVETLTETARVTAGHDKVANETAKLSGVVAVGLQRMDESSVVDGQEHGQSRATS